MSTPPAPGAAPGKERLLRVLGALALLLVLVVAYRADLLDPVTMRDLILSFGILAPVIWVLIYLVAVFIPYATTIMTVAAGLAFGAVWGAVLTFSVTIFASLIPFTVARRLGRAWVEARVGGTRLQRYSDLINRNAFLVFFYLRLIPSLPYELQNHIAGVTRITYRQFMLASALGIGPIILILTFLGDALSEPGSRDFWIATAIWVTALSAPLFVALIRRRMGKPPLLEGVG
jgi:uncharacterized membrane protein YdjX (TVP38/TMEM64 family)